MSNPPQIRPADLTDHAVLLDVREQDEWDLGHAPGAVHIPLGDLPARIAELPVTDAAPLAVACRVGGRSAQAVAWLTQQGVDVVNLDGGMVAWDAAGKQMVSQGPEAPRVK